MLWSRPWSLIVLTLLLSLGGTAWAADPPVLPDFKTDPEGFKKVVRENLKGDSGHIVLAGGQAALDLDEGYTYLEGIKGRFLLERLWGNPADDSIMGVILPPNFVPWGEGAAWAATVSYNGDGHIDDQDAKSMNFDDLLKQMKEGAEESNKARKEAGFGTVELIGWATKPHYDSGTKKLYWAKELQFEGEKERTLNSMIRILGREGTLDINVVAGIADLPKVEAATPHLLSKVNFVPGKTYSDYVPGTDHLAEIGVAGLILGGIAVKAGLFKVILAALAASWKFILIGLGAVGAFVAKKFFKKKDKPSL
jgi:uncharacterized membrane-anchored protein